MLVSFIGCPCSGKTTTAAMTFAMLKEKGLTAEFIAEQARLYIAEKKYMAKDHVITLDDDDQLQIMKHQLHVEKVMAASAASDSIVVCDSSSLNSLLYMSEAGRERPEVKEMVEAATHYDLVFYCPPVAKPVNPDPNRVHDYNASLQINEILPRVLKQHAPTLQLIPVTGDVEARYRLVFAAILDKLYASLI